MDLKDRKYFSHSNDLNSLKEFIKKTGIENIDEKIVEDEFITSCNNEDLDIASYILSISNFDTTHLNYLLEEITYTGNIQAVKLIAKHIENFDMTDALRTSVTYKHKDIFDFLLPLCQTERHITDAFITSTASDDDYFFDTLFPLANQNSLDGALVNACFQDNERIIDKLIPYCTDKIFSNKPLEWAITNNNMDLFNKLFPLSNKKSLEKPLVVSIVYSRENIIDILFDYCNIKQVKEDIKEKSASAGLNYFLKKLDSIETKRKLKDVLADTTNKTTQKPKIM